jgi:hypothetical protein
MEELSPMDVGQRVGPGLAAWLADMAGSQPRGQVPRKLSKLARRVVAAQLAAAAGEKDRETVAALLGVAAFVVSAPELGDMVRRVLCGMIEAAADPASADQAAAWLKELQELLDACGLSPVPGVAIPARAVPAAASPMAAAGGRCGCADGFAPKGWMRDHYPQAVPVFYRAVLGSVEWMILPGVGVDLANVQVKLRSTSGDAGPRRVVEVFRGEPGDLVATLMLPLSTTDEEASGIKAKSIGATLFVTLPRQVGTTIKVEPSPGLDPEPSPSAPPADQSAPQP